MTTSQAWLAIMACGRIYSLSRAILLSTDDRPSSGRQLNSSLPWQKQPKFPGAMWQ